MLDPSFLQSVNVSVLPRSDNTYDLGSPSYQWRHLYLGGRLYLSGNNWSIHSYGEHLDIREPEDSDLVWMRFEDTGSGSGRVWFRFSILPFNDASSDLGRLGNRFRNLYLSGIVHADWVASEEIYVSPTGGGDGTSYDSPTTFDDALARAKARRVVIYLLDGEYHVSKYYTLVADYVEIRSYSWDETKVKIVFDTYSDGSYNKSYGIRVIKGTLKFSKVTLENAPKTDDTLPWAVGGGAYVPIEIAGDTTYDGLLIFNGCVINQSRNYFVSAKHGGARIVFTSTTINMSGDAVAFIINDFGSVMIGWWNSSITSGYKLTTGLQGRDVLFSGNINSISATKTWFSEVPESVLPKSDNAYDLGSESLKWRTVYTYKVRFKNDVGKQIEFPSTTQAFHIENIGGKFRIVRTDVDYPFTIDGVNGRIGLWTSFPDYAVHIKTGSTSPVTTFAIEKTVDEEASMKFITPNRKWTVGINSSGTSANSFFIHDTTAGRFRLELTVDGLAKIDAHVLPRSDNTYDLGRSDLRWRNLFVAYDAVLEKLWSVPDMILAEDDEGLTAYVSTAGGTTYVVAFFDNTVVYVNGKFQGVLNAGQRLSLTLSVGDIISANKPIMVHSSSERHVPITWKDTKFVIPFYRSDPQTIYIFALDGDATVDIYVGTSTTPTTTVTVTKGTTTKVQLNVTPPATVILESTSPILVAVSSNNETYDFRFIHPPAKDLIGIPSSVFYVSALEDGTTITWFQGNKSGTYTLNRGEIVSNTTLGIATGSQYNATPVRVIADKPIMISSFADGDGIDATCGLPVNKLGTYYVLPVAAQWLSIAVPFSNTRVRIYYQGQLKYETTVLNTYSNNTPTLLYLNPADIDSSWTSIPYGTVIESDKPIMIVFDCAEVWTDDETVLLGINHRKWRIHQNPVLTLTTDIVPPQDNTYNIGNDSYRFSNVKALYAWFNALNINDSSWTTRFKLDLDEANSRIVFRSPYSWSFQFNQNVIPGSDNAFDLGSSTLRWRNLYLGGDAQIGGKASINKGALGLLIDNVGSSKFLHLYAGSIGAVIAFTDTHDRLAIGTFSYSDKWSTAFPTNELVSIKSGGNVGIGTTSPSERLHVKGNIRGYSVYPDADNAYDLGSLSLRWHNLYLANRAYIPNIDSSVLFNPDGNDYWFQIKSSPTVFDQGGLELHQGAQYSIRFTTCVTGSTGGYLHIFGWDRTNATKIADIARFYVSGVLQTSNLRPLADNTYDLGSSSLNWRRVFGYIHRFTPTSPPSSPLEGDVIYDSADKVLKYYNGSKWLDAVADTVAVNKGNTSAVTVTETTETLKQEVTPDAGYRYFLYVETIHVVATNPSGSGCSLTFTLRALLDDGTEVDLASETVAEGSNFDDYLQWIYDAITDGKRIKSIRLYAYVSATPASGYEPTVQLHYVAGIQMR